MRQAIFFSFSSRAPPRDWIEAVASAISSERSRIFSRQLASKSPVSLILVSHRSQQRRGLSQFHTASRQFVADLAAPFFLDYGIVFKICDLIGGVD